MGMLERNSISDPAEGLIVFCTNCGKNESGVISVFTGGKWFNLNLCTIDAPTAAGNGVYAASLLWRWNAVPDALGYKWSTTNSLASAIDVGTDTTKAELDIECDTLYTRYIWAYNECGYSTPLVLSQTDTICWGCGDTLYINHIAGDVAPVDKSTTYGTLDNIPGETSKCWITSNLGSTRQATSTTDSTEASAGWYWQFNRRQGYKYNGTTRTPNSTWITEINEYSVWNSSNDPCTLELGPGWRIPTITEWEHVDSAGNWVNYNGPYDSDLKIHTAGRIDDYYGLLLDRGSKGFYWSSTQTTLLTLAQNLYFNSSNCIMGQYAKAQAYSIRCLRD
jgi:hypothetical protein